MSKSDAVNKYVEAMRQDLSRGKVEIINRVMQLSAAESKVFWPIYQEYESELFELGEAEPLAAMVVHAVEQDLKQPGAAVGARLEAMERFPPLQVGFLYDVLGPCRIAKHARRRAEQVGT